MPGVSFAIEPAGTFGLVGGRRSVLERPDHRGACHFTAPDCGAFHAGPEVVLSADTLQELGKSLTTTPSWFSAPAPQR